MNGGKYRRVLGIALLVVTFSSASSAETVQKAVFLISGDRVEPATAWLGRVKTADGRALSDQQGLESVPVATIPAGGIAIREWKTVDWSGFDQLVLTVSADRAGTVVLRLTENREEIPEGFTFYREIEEGKQKITVDLAEVPKGDLIPSTVAPVNGIWDPDFQSPVSLGFIALPGEFKIYSVELRRDSENIQ